jgi:hypothetical protein
MIGNNDRWIAAQIHGGGVDTGDQQRKRIPPVSRLKIQNWAL